jgi:excinuclease UvrABC nuclease subunit
MDWDYSLPFSPERSADIITSLPESPAVFQLRSADPSAEPYINKTANLRKRLDRLLSPASPDSKRLNLSGTTTSVDYTLTGSDFENRLLLYYAMKAAFPRSYRKRMKLIPAPLVKIGWENDYPRAYFTRRLGKGPSNIYYGPFASKAAANKFLNDALDLFKSRRCTFNIHPDPSFPGCIYSEMHMCLAPCFAGCTDDEYRAEVTRVQEYLDTRAGSLAAQLEAERDNASKQLEFEQAAALHGKIEKAKAPWSGVPEIVGRIRDLHAVVVQRSALPDHIALFEFRDGLIFGPVQFNTQGMLHPNPSAGSTSLFAHPHMAEPVPLESLAPTPGGRPKPQNLEARLRELLSNRQNRQPQPGEVTDHLALLKRWYYRKNRKGEIFITHSGELPVRRIVRGISRVFRGEVEEVPAQRAAEESIDSRSS